MGVLKALTGFIRGGEWVVLLKSKGVLKILRGSFREPRGILESLGGA